MLLSTNEDRVVPAMHPWTGAVPVMVVMPVMVQPDHVIRFILWDYSPAWQTLAHLTPCPGDWGTPWLSDFNFLFLASSWIRKK